MFLRYVISTRSLVYLARAMVCCLCTSCAAGQQADCSVYLPVYDGVGNRVHVRIGAVIRQDQSREDLLRRGVVRVDEQSLIHFPRALIQSGLLSITLIDDAGRSFKRTLIITSCKQRSSYQYGELDTEFDVSNSSLDGRLEGCDFVGDWWVRLSPMFGTNMMTEPLEGRIDPGTGTFSITGPMIGGRHIVTVGKEKDIVLSFSTNIIMGGRNESQTINLLGRCPK